ncbi:MAG: TetR/AcrR family transcriptional regulator [Chitinophagaceae bacterium]|nr:TetR/AcrR family transcriptional regulator [Chitinophagaceae bacterium]
MSDKRLHILEAAEVLFAEKGFDGTSVRDIAAHANVNLAMISYYFGSKEKLLASLIEHRAGYTRDIIEELAKNENLAPFEKIDRLVDLYVDKIFIHSKFHCIVTTHLPTMQSGEIKDMMADIKFRNLEQIKKILADGQKKKVFGKVDMELTVASIMGTITQVTSSKAFYYKVFNIEKNNHELYNRKMIPKLKTHLKQLLHAHLNINNHE